MAPRAIWSGSVSFGLVSIPIKMFSASESGAEVSFHMLHAKCGARVKQGYSCSACGAKVERAEMAKGVEVGGKFVTFTAEELKAVEEASSHCIEIAEFVPLAKVEPVFYEKAYFLGPAPGGAKAYALLAEALVRSGKAAIGSYAARGKGHLVLIRAVEGRLVLHELHYAEEVRSIAEVPVEAASPSEAEIGLALRLVEQCSSESFRPESYVNEYAARAKALIEAKVAGGALPAPVEEKKAEVVDLAAALEASLAKGKAKPAAPVAAPAAPAAPANEPAAPVAVPKKRAPRAKKAA